MNVRLPGGERQSLAYKCAPQLWRSGFAILVVAFGAACMEGYPTHDVPAVDLFDMTQEQRLAQMNSLGSEAHATRRWTYDLLPGCVLRIDFDGEAGPRPSFDLPLLGAAVNVATDKADKTFDVEVQPTSTAAPKEVAVLESQEWLHATAMSRILRVVRKGCADG